MPKRTTPYAPWLLDKLKDPKIALQFLRRPVNLLRIFSRHCEKSRRPIKWAKVAEAAGRQRESVYRMLSEEGNPPLR